MPQRHGGEWKIRNPKVETRKKAETRNPNSPSRQKDPRRVADQTENTSMNGKAPLRSLRSFAAHSAFGFRASSKNSPLDSKPF
jgi:hypothetical protein